MATIEKVSYSRFEAKFDENLKSITWDRSSIAREASLPQIFWSNGAPWREVNMWAARRVLLGAKLATALSALGHIRAYATWLEEHGLTWTDFPDREEQRCLTRFRGELIRQRDKQKISATTASARMGTILRFYRWAQSNGLIEPGKQLWKDRKVLLPVDQKYGLRRSLLITSSELSLPSTPARILTLEGGVLPVSIDVSRKIVDFASQHASIETALLLRVAFSTGMRIGTILSLKTRTIERAAPHTKMSGWFTVSVGPSATVPVKTKRDKSGEIFVPSRAIDALKEYIRSPRRLKRVALANKEHRDLIFVTRFGRPFGNDPDESGAMNTNICRLREKAKSLGVDYLTDFNFHRARATFGTELAKIALKHGGLSFSIWLVKNALMHQNERDTLRYIKFVQSISALEQASDEFSLEFFGMEP